MKPSVFSALEMDLFYQTSCSGVKVGLLFLEEIFEHKIIMEQDKEEFCRVSLGELLEVAYQCEVRVVGAVKEIFKHKRYIVELLIDDEVSIRCLKRYSEFEALHQVIQMNFKNIDLRLPEFPSKFQVLSREQTRRKYFETFLNSIIQIYLEKITNETNRRLFSTLYVFFSCNQSSPRKTSGSFGSDSTGDKQEYLSIDKSEEEEEPRKRERVRTLGGESASKKEELLNIKVIQEIDVSSEESRLRAFMGNQFLIRFQESQEWKQRYLKLQGTCLLIYRHKHENHFKNKIQLFQAKIEYLHRQKNSFDHFCQKMQFDNEPQYPQNTDILTVSHQYDFKKLLIMVKPDQKLQLSLVKQILTKASRESLATEIEGVFSPIGKMFIILHKLVFAANRSKTVPIIYVRIRASGLVYDTKRMTYVEDTPINIKQGFMIPISNAFASILVEVISIQNEGIIRHESQQKCIGLYKISFADFISYPSGQGLEKIKIKIEQSSPNMAAYQGFMEVSIINYSHPTSMYADSYANENDGLMMSGLKKTSDTDELVITVDRVLRVIGNIALFITAFWRNVYLFKYPRMGYVFFSFLILLFNFGSAFFYLRLLLYSLILAMFYHLPLSRELILNILDVCFFKYRHPFFVPPLSLSTNELKFRKWTNNLLSIKNDFRLTENGKLEKTQQAKDKKYEEWTFVVHDKKFYLREECPSFLEKIYEVKKIVELVLRMISAVINTLQKVFNVLCWADPRRSVIVFVILLLVANVASTYIFQFIGTVFCVHRLFKGYGFYHHKHYRNNRKLAVFALRFIINQNFTLILGKDKKISSTDQAEIQAVLSEIFFPFREEDKLKKLKNQIEHILGVYIDTDELENREEKAKERKGMIALIHLVTIIESCESRLKLEWISGQEGISDSFQELKKLTNEDLVIDLWVQSLLINFFLNLPSQLYTTFRPVRSQESLKFEYPEEGDLPTFKKITI